MLNVMRQLWDIINKTVNLIFKGGITDEIIMANAPIITMYKTRMEIIRFTPFRSKSQQAD